MEVRSIVAGFVAFGFSVLASVLLVFVTYRFNTLVTSRIDEERHLLSGHRSVAIALGSVVLAQAILLRHAVFPTMVVIRELFVQPVSAAAVASALGHVLLFFVIIGVLSFGSVALAVWLFTRMTGALPEQEEILKDNLAVAIFFGFVVIAIALIVNEGMSDLARSIIPFAHSGVLRVE
jgi:uncharacterized membrane protein YjfL (UPF0719 family)